MTTYDKTTPHNPSPREERLAWEERRSIAERRKGELRVSDGEWPRLYNALNKRNVVREALRGYANGNYAGDISEFEAVHAPMKKRAA